VLAGNPAFCSWKNTLTELAASPDQRTELLAMARQQMQPATAVAIAKAAAILTGLPSQNNSGESAKAAQAVFEIGLADMPADLLGKALERACKTCRWRPTPAELRALVADDIAERATRLARLLAITERAN
jgi:hypothetical protein